MNKRGELILQHLGAVRVERAARAADAALAERVLHVKRYQQSRFALTYADLLSHPRYAGASRFFLDDLYGPGDFSQRDAQYRLIGLGMAFINTLALAGFGLFVGSHAFWISGVIGTSLPASNV